METRTNSLIQNSNNNTSRTFIVELLFAIYCCVPSINDILYCFIGRSVMTFLYLLVIASLVVVAFLKIQKLKEKSFLDSTFVSILIYIILLYAISTVLSYSSIEPVYFISWFIVPFFAGPLLIILGYVCKCLCNIFTNISINLHEINRKMKE